MGVSGGARASWTKAGSSGEDAMGVSWLSFQTPMPAAPTIATAVTMPRIRMSPSRRGLPGVRGLCCTVFPSVFLGAWRDAVGVENRIDALDVVQHRVQKLGVADLDDEAVLDHVVRGRVADGGDDIDPRLA